MTTPPHYNIPAVSRHRASGGVIALGVINIIYAVFFRLCCGVSALFYGLLGGVFLKLAEMQKAQLPPIQMLPTGAVKSYLIISAFVLLILGSLLLIGGIGLLTLKSWGRTLTLGVAAAEIVWVVIDFAISVFFVAPMTIQATGGTASQGTQMIGNVVLQIFAAILKLVYPVILLICLNLKSVREQFEPPSQQQIVS